MTRVRGFEPVKKEFRKDRDKEIDLPERGTKSSAGYDFFSTETVVVPSIWKIAFRALGTLFNNLENDHEKEKWDNAMKPTLIKTDVKAYMQEDEALFLYSRSSTPIKKLFLIGNGVGVIDSDYYSNKKNDGNIMFQFFNFGLFDKKILVGEKIGQGVFQKYLKADGDKAEGERTGGIGSTGKQ